MLHDMLFLSRGEYVIAWFNACSSSVLGLAHINNLSLWMFFNSGNKAQSVDLSFCPYLLMAHSERFFCLRHPWQPRSDAKRRSSFSSFWSFRRWKTCTQITFVRFWRRIPTRAFQWTRRRNAWRRPATARAERLGVELVGLGRWWAGSDGFGWVNSEFVLKP